MTQQGEYAKGWGTGPSQVWTPMKGHFSGIVDPKSKRWVLVKDDVDPRKRVWELQDGSGKVFKTKKGALTIGGNLAEWTKGGAKNIKNLLIPERKNQKEPLTEDDKFPHYFPFTKDRIDRDKFPTSQDFNKNQLKVDTDETKTKIKLTPHKINQEKKKWSGSNVNPPKEHWDKVKNPWFIGPDADKNWNEAKEILKINHQEWLRKKGRKK